MELFYAPISPFARKVLMVALERGVPIPQKTIVDPWSVPASLSRHNPLSQVPTLVVHGQPEIGQPELVLFDSNVICEFLDSHGHGRPGVHTVPRENTREKWGLLVTQSLCDGVMAASVLRRQERVRPRNLFSQDWDSRQAQAVRRGLGELERNAREGKVLSDSRKPIDCLTIADIAAVSALGYLDLRFADEPWRDSHKNLADWLERLQPRPSVSATAPPKV
jgi:glutathione S-transferase